MNVRRVSRSPRIEASFNPPSSCSNGRFPSAAIFYESRKQTKEVGLDFRRAEFDVGRSPLGVRRLLLGERTTSNAERPTPNIKPKKKAGEGNRTLVTFQ
jgi:hypothetical protein